MLTNGSKTNVVVNWRLNLVILWFGLFLTKSAMTMIIPFLPFYLQANMGITDPREVALWSGVIFAGNFVTSFISQPFWGRIADRYGRKIMLLRSGFGMCVVLVLMGFAGNAWQLLVLRLINGTIAGFIPAASALVSANTPIKNMGYAMGILQSGMVTGTILGPLIGGVLAENIGFRSIFYVTGALTFISTVTVGLFVKEKFDVKKATSKAQISIFKNFMKLASIYQLPALFTVTLLIQFAVLSSLPVIPLFVQELRSNEGYVVLFAALVSSVTGLSNLIASPILGKLSDRIGSRKILFFCLIGAGTMYIPQAFVQSVWQLLIVCFILGIFMGGILPSVNALIRTHTPDGMESVAYGFNSSFLGVGGMMGSVSGGILVGFIGIRGIFIMVAVMLLFNAAWVYKNFQRKL